MTHRYVSVNGTYASAGGLAREGIAEARREAVWWLLNVVIGNQQLRKAVHGEDVVPDLSEELLGKVRALRAQLNPVDVPH